MNNKDNMKLKHRKIGIIILLVAVMLLALLFNRFISGKENIKEEINTVKQVETIVLSNMEQKEGTIVVAGKVTPGKKVDVVSLTQGTAISSPFNVGDDISLNQVLVYLNSNTIQTSHLNSQINYTNMINNLESVRLTTSESVRQAELGVNNSEQSVLSAMIALESAKDNLRNTSLLQDKAYIDRQEQAVISFYEFLNSIDNALNQINYIIHVDEGPQLDGIAATLSARDYQKLNDAKSSYVVAREARDGLQGIELNNNNVQNKFTYLNSVLGLVKIAVDDTIDVINNTVTSSSFSEVMLTTQKTAFTSLRSSIVASQSSAANTLNGLENLTISDRSSVESLENTVESAQKNVDLVRGSYNNSVVALNSARQAKNQQILIAQASVDNALGQLNLSSNQISELTISAPIQGKVTAKLIETGSEVRIGQKVAEISQVDTLKIEINLAAEDVNKVKVGQEVKINDSLVGIINLIDPSADEITRKVKAEVLFDNKNNELISGTFVDVSMDISGAGISSQDSSIILIPLKTLSISQAEKFVFIAECSDEVCLARKAVVEVGKTKGKMIEVLKGLDKEDELLVTGSKTVMDGEEIIIKR